MKSAESHKISNRGKRESDKETTLHCHTESIVANSSRNFRANDTVFISF